MAAIPLIVFLINKLAGNTNSWVKTSVIYALYFVATYLVHCWVISMWLLASNDFYKPGQELSYHLRQVNLNQIFLTSVVVTTVLTAPTLVVIKMIARHKSNASSLQA